MGVKELLHYGLSQIGLWGWLVTGCLVFGE